MYRLTTTMVLAAALATAAAGAEPEAGPPVPSDRHDAEVTAADASGGEVMVTARRRLEDAQKVPGSLSVVGGDLLDRSYTVNAQELSQLVPSVNYSSANPRNTSLTIRGLGSSVVAVSQANDGLEPGVGFYIDQVYHARPASAAFDFSDIDHIEILRGPQGTLFGKNSTAGAVSITTRLPSFDFAAAEELSIGNYGFVQGKGFVTGALSDTVAARVSVVGTSRDGVIDNVVTGRRHNDVANQAVRGELLFKPSAALQVRLIADWTNFDSNCCTQVFYGVAPTLKPAARQFAALATGVGYSPPSRDPYARLTDIDAPLGVNTSEGGVSAIADWNLGTATLTSVSAWRFWNWDAANDRDYTGLPIQLIQHIPSRQDQYSQELRLASNGDRKLSYVAGLYFFRQRIIGRPISIYGPLATYWLLGPAPAYPANLLDGYGTDGRTDFQSNSYAAFGEVNWRPLPRLTLTGGLRYTYEHKKGTYDTFTFGGPAGLSPALVNSQLSILRGQDYLARVSDGALTGRANVAYDFTDMILGYASFARGAKSGGINESGLPTNNLGQPALNTAVVKPEENTNYEVGVKTRLFDRRLTLNVDGFYTRVTDFQANVTDSGAAAALRTYLANVPRVSVRGFEADAVLTPVRNLSLRASVAYAEGRYDLYPNAPCPIELIGSTTTFCNLTGRPLSSLPRWSETIGGDYSLPARPKLDIVLHADANFRSPQFGDPTDSAYTRSDAYAVVNASVGLRTRGGYEVALFARNLFNANYIQNVTIQTGNSGLILATPSDPRVFGITFRARQ